MSTGFAFTERLHLCTVSNLRIVLVFQLRNLKVDFSGTKTFRSFRGMGPRGPFLERPGNFLGPKSHFKNHEAFYVQSFLCQQVLHLSKTYNYAAFRI